MDPNVTRYVLVDPAGVESDYEYVHFSDARSIASRLGFAVVERVYIYDDSELVWTPDGSDVWPQS